MGHDPGQGQFGPGVGITDQQVTVPKLPIFAIDQFIRGIQALFQCGHRRDHFQCGAGFVHIIHRLEALVGHRTFPSPIGVETGVLGQGQNIAAVGVDEHPLEAGGMQPIVGQLQFFFEDGLVIDINGQPDMGTVHRRGPPGPVAIQRLTPGIEALNLAAVKPPEVCFILQLDAGNAPVIHVGEADHRRRQAGVGITPPDLWAHNQSPEIQGQQRFGFPGGNIAFQPGEGPVAVHQAQVALSRAVKNSGKQIGQRIGRLQYLGVHREGIVNSIGSERFSSPGQDLPPDGRQSLQRGALTVGPQAVVVMVQDLDEEQLGNDAQEHNGDGPVDQRDSGLILGEQPGHWGISGR